MRNLTVYKTGGFVGEKYHRLGKTGGLVGEKYDRLGKTGGLVLVGEKSDRLDGGLWGL